VDGSEARPVTPEGVNTSLFVISPDGKSVAAIGPGTARALSEHGIRADVVPERYVAESLLEALEAVPFRRALIARALDARDVLPEGLRARGAEVEVLSRYETRWCAGFQIDSVRDDGYMLRRHSDNAVLPVTFGADAVRPRF